MRNKGFTLIELLAVLVILAIIAVIAVPIVLGIIEDSRNEANERSIEMYAKAIKNGLATYQLENDDEVEVGTYTSKTLPFKVSYDGDVECDTIKIRQNKKLTISNCKVNGEEVNYIYGVTTLGDHIISNNGGYSKAIDLKGEKKVVNGLTNAKLGESITLYFSDEVEIDYENQVFKLVGNVQQKTIKVNEISNIDKGIYGAPNVESSYVYKDFTEGYGYDNSQYILKATEQYFDYEYNSKAGTGLYKIEDDLGDSYYFRGDVKNNYVKLSGKEIVHHEAIKEEAYTPIDIIDASTICGEDQECLQEAGLFLSVYSKIVFTSKEECESFTNGELWTTCQLLDKKEVYHIDEDEPIYFKTEQECVESYNTMGAEITSCEKYTLKNEDAHDEVVYNDTYYRIVRINGDGTIRLIYDGDSLVENGKEHTATTTDSLDTWYQNTITKYSLDKYIANTEFYEKNISYDYFSDTGYVDYYYYTYKTSDLKQDTPTHKKIGLLSASEAAIAGALGPISNNYLSGSSFKTVNLSQKITEKFPYTDKKTTDYYYVLNDKGVLTTATTGSIRPVINLIEDVPFTGTGTIDDPYVIKSY